MEWLANAEGLIALGLLVAFIVGLVCLVRQWKSLKKAPPQNGDAQADLEQRILARSQSLGRLMVSEVDVKSLVFMKYDPCLMEALKRYASLGLGGRKAVELTWKHRAAIPFYVDLEAVQVDCNRDAQGAVCSLTIVLPPPVYDKACLKINLQTFECVKSSCKLTDCKNEYEKVEKRSKKIVVADLKKVVNDRSLVEDARIAARVVLQHFYAGFVPGLPLTICFAEKEGMGSKEAGDAASGDLESDKKGALSE